MPESPDDAFKTVQQTAAQMPTWTVTVTDPATRTIEGYSTSKSVSFQTTISSLRCGPVRGLAAWCEMRSKSRDGIGDHGVNYKRIKGFFAARSPSFERLAQLHEPDLQMYAVLYRAPSLRLGGSRLTAQRRG